jgi:hypothetical protein
MKLINMRILIYVGLIGSVLTSCLQGDPMNTPPNGTGSIVSTAINSSGSWQITPLAVDASATEGQYDLVLVVLNNLPGGAAPQDIHVTMVPALDSLTNYNTANGTNYVMPGVTGTPAFTLVDGGVVTIPKGSTYGYLKIKTTPNDYFGKTNYAFSYRISAVQETGYTISTNNAYSIVPFIPKNKYDGEYTVTGTLVDKASGAINGSCSYPMDAYLVTQSASVVYLYDRAIPGYYHTICSGGSLSYYGNTGVAITFDANDNVTSIDNIYADPAPRSRTLQLDPSGVNKYDPATKTLKIKYWLNQANSVQPHRTYFDETFTYTASR